MKQDLLRGGYMQADETPIRCNDPDLRAGTTTTGWLWALSRPGGDVVFAGRLSRRRKEAARLLGDFPACSKPTATKPCDVKSLK